MHANRSAYAGSETVDEFFEQLSGFSRVELEGLSPSKIKELISGTKLPSLLVSREHGGGGLEVRDIMYALRDVAYRFPSAALMLCMHYHVVSTIAQFPKSFPFSESLLNSVCNDNSLVASAFAESGASQSIFQTSVRADVRRDRTVVSGSKRPCTMSSVADFIAASVVTESDVPGIVIVSRGKRGLSSKPFWPADLLAGTDSNEVIFDNVEIESDWAVFAEDDSFEVYLNYGLACFNLLIGAAYTGVCQAVVDKLDQGASSASAVHLELAGKLAQCFYSLAGISIEVKPKNLEHIVPTVLCLRYQVQRDLKGVKNEVTENIGSKLYLGDSELHYLLKVIDLLPFHPVTRSGFDRLMEK